MAASSRRCLPAVGIWLGRKLTRDNRKGGGARSPGARPRPSSCAIRTRWQSLGITPRELEILELIAQGLSNKEIAERVFVSENTVKTHSSRVFDKLGARRRTQAVQLGKELRLIP